MEQKYTLYKDQDHETWSKLFSRQTNNLQDKASQTYLDSLAELNPVLNENKIPVFSDLSSALREKNGWQIEVVPGLIPVVDFFELLSQKKFCSSTWIRKPEQLDYIEEPDMFHDIYGHTPLFMNSEFADFMSVFGEIGVHYKSNQDIIDQLQRLYWFTIEFGVMQEGADTKIYGAGILSSYGETNHVMKLIPDAIEFDVETIFNHSFRNDVIQDTYYRLTDFTQLKSSLLEWHEKSCSKSET